MNTYNILSFIFIATFPFWCNLIHTLFLYVTPVRTLKKSNITIANVYFFKHVLNILENADNNNFQTVTIQWRDNLSKKQIVYKLKFEWVEFGNSIQWLKLELEKINTNENICGIISLRCQPITVKYDW
jgi:hypothetical protein